MWVELGCEKIIMNPKIWCFPSCKGGVFLYFLCLSADTNENVTGFLMEYPEKEGIHKDPQT